MRTGNESTNLIESVRWIFMDIYFALSDEQYVVIYNYHIH